MKIYALDALPSPLHNTGVAAQRAYILEMIMDTPTIDGTLGLSYIQCLLEALTPKLFDRLIAEAHYDIVPILAVTAPGQYGVPLAQQIALHQTINRICGEATLRLLNHNMGVKIAQSPQTLQHPMSQELQGKYASLPARERVNQTLAEFCDNMSQMGVPLISVRSDDQSWAITYNDCVACAGLQVSSPICAAMGVIMRMQVQRFCAIPLVVTEILCQGVGDAICCYRLALA